MPILNVSWSQRTMIRLILIITFAVSQTLTFAQGGPPYVGIPLEVYPATYVCYRTVDEIKVDGVAHEQTWQRAHPLSKFVDIEGDTKPAPTWDTRVQMAWDDDFLYLFAFLEEPHVWATLQNRDDIIYRDDDFEIFIDADQDTHNYVEFEFNAFGTLLDLFMVKPYRDGGPMLIEWDAKGIQSAVSISGTINEGNDKDEGWSLEVAIPFNAIKLRQSEPSPTEGTRWQINFSRVAWDKSWDDESYVKQKNEQGQVMPEHNWVWSPQGIVNMHYPEMWGFMQFSTDAVGTAPFPFYFVAGEAERIWLRKVYYAQRLYKLDKGVFSDSLEELLQYYDGMAGVKELLSIQLSPSGYDCTIHIKQKFGAWNIDETGRIWKNE
jgi:hypothetical protein